MKNGYIKTAAATPYITVADCNANGNEIIRLIHEMEKEHVKVMTFPELCITGYTCQDLFLQRRLLDSAWETLQQIFIHLEKHYLPYVEKQIVCYSSETCHYSGLFSDAA